MREPPLAKSTHGLWESRASAVWPEIWKDIGPRIERVLETGEASWDETLPLILERGGYPEETYHTFSYSPLVGPDGGNAGMLCVVMEDTGRVLGERQLASLGALAAALVDANTKAEVFAAIERGLEGQKDIPFALLYLFDERDCARLRLVARCGIEKGHPAACDRLTIGSSDCPWSVEALCSNQPVTVENLPGIVLGSAHWILGPAAGEGPACSFHAQRPGDARRHLHRRFEPLPAA